MLRNHHPAEAFVSAMNRKHLGQRR